jgi:hypothetical protein
MEAQNTGVWIAMAAILVQAPRLVLAVLAADHQVIAATWESALLILAGCGTALVLTGGNLYLAPAIARVRRWRAGLVVVWLIVLASTGGLIVPLIAAGIGGRTLPQVLDRQLLAWAWSLLAALAHEVTAAGCMLSAAALASTAAAAAHERSQSVAIDELLAQRDAARRELVPARAAEPGSAAAGTGDHARCRQRGAGHYQEHGCSPRAGGLPGGLRQELQLAASRDGPPASLPGRLERLSRSAAAGS